ncbi:MAG: integral rane sensor hybrid histidine kinase [Brevundimonas sp.]|nr:integral rane sensor hybrid histidine kinase [Brevundimonas sp.]
MSEVRIQSTAANWRTALVQRRKALGARLATGVATAMIFTPVLGWRMSAIWLAVYLTAALLEPLVFAPVLRNTGGRMPKWRTFLGGAILFLNAASFGSLSLMLLISCGVMGGICAFIVLASGAVYATVNALRSAQVMALTVSPHFLYLATTPMFMARYGAEPSYVSACLIAVMVFMGYCVSTWRSIDKAYQAESRARLAAEQRRAEAEAALASRSAFLAAIGHDLRTPIGAILTGSSEMQRVASDGFGRAHAALITDAGLMMKALLDNLLDQAKLDAGRMTVEADDFNLRSMLAQTMRLWTGPVRAKGLALRIEGAHEMPAMVRGDAMRLRQVLNNLLSNALKFTETGSVTLRLKGWAEEPSGHALLIEVVDTGPGMTADQMSRLFSAFDQTADGVSARHGGTGLGLAISRDLAQLMGGRLTARSEPGQGASFTLSLVMGPAINEAVVAAPLDAETRADISRQLAAAPAAARPAPQPASASAPVSATDAALAALLAMDLEPVRAPDLITVEPAIKPAAEVAEMADEVEEQALRILVVDDHDINRRAVELILSPLGCDIASAADGMAALRLCETDAYDVIFMDVRMPELDGRETTRRIRAGGGINAGVPIIAVTADTGPDDVAACMDAGMTYFVSKPLTPPALLHALQHVLAGQTDDADLATAAA